MTSPGKPNLLAIAIVFGRDFTDPPPIRPIPSSTNASKRVGDEKDGESAEEASFAACVASLCCSAWKDLESSIVIMSRVLGLAVACWAIFLRLGLQE
jgi:hypothetical protein